MQMVWSIFWELVPLASKNARRHTEHYLFPITKFTVLTWLPLTVTGFSHVFASVKTGRCTLRSVRTSKACSLPARPQPSCQATI